MAAVLNAKDVVDKSGLVLKGAIRVINKALANDTDTVEQILQVCESLSASLDEIGNEEEVLLVLVLRWIDDDGYLFYSPPLFFFFLLFFSRETKQGD